MIESILKIAAQDNLQFGMVALILLAIIVYVFKTVTDTNKHLVSQNQKNIVEFLNQVNHQQTKNRESLEKNTQVLDRMHQALDKNNEINARLISFLKNGNE